ncbi:MAG: sugar transferase [Rhizobiaceae bacterium]|nr:sugar transferase [Rhizobiaceae bacterium]
MDLNGRLFDTGAAAIGLLLASPVLLACALLIRLDSPGPALLRQVRIGENGKPFTCVKLRTMHADTGDRPTHEVGRSAVTRVGHFLRRTKLDELPQLWNVLAGDMNIVGPRPCLPTQLELIEARRKAGVLAMRPGITGVSQIAGVDMSDPERLAKLDATYRRSLSADLRIIAATILGAGQGDRTTSGA